MKPSIGKGLPLDLSRLIETRLLIQANSGGGKSWAIRRLLEQTHGKDAPVQFPGRPGEE